MSLKTLFLSNYVSLQKLTESEISLLTNTFFNNGTDDSQKNSPLTVLLNELRQHTLESLDIVEDKDNMNKNLASFQIGQSIPCLSHFDKFMPDKKMHEVGVISQKHFFLKLHCPKGT